MVPQLTLFALGLGVLLLTVVELGWEWRATRRVPDFEERAGNWLCLLIGSALRFATLPLRLAVFTWAAGLAPVSLPSSVLGFAACYVLTDLAYYVQHRLLHGTAVGWAVHSVHHSSKAIELSVAFRLNWAARMVDDFFYLPLVLLGFAPAMVLFAIELNLFTQTWVHTEMIRRVPVLDWWLNTPSNHRVHHHLVPGGRRWNYGSHLMVWDRLFGTYRAEGQPAEYGTDFGALGPRPVRIQLEGLRRLVKGTLRVAPPGDGAA